MKSSLTLVLCFENNAHISLSPQSSLNSEGHLGMASLSVIYGCFLIGSVIGPVYAKLIGHKNILVLSFILHLCYTCSNIKPGSALLLAISAVFGICVGSNAMSKGVYIVAMSTSYIREKGLPQDNLYGIMSFFYGIFYFSFKATQVTGNLMSSAILQSVSYNQSVLLENKCGSRACSKSQYNADFDRPSNQVIHILFGSFALCDIVGLAIIAFGLPYLKNSAKEGAKEEEVCKKVKQHVGDTLDMLLTPKMLLLVPSIMAQSMMTMIIQTGYTNVSHQTGSQFEFFYEREKSE